MTKEIRTSDQVDREILDQERRAALIEASPACERDECGHKLCYHDPCSRCSCPEFVGERP